MPPLIHCRTTWRFQSPAGVGWKLSRNLVIMVLVSREVRSGMTQALLIESPMHRIHQPATAGDECPAADYDQIRFSVVPRGGVCYHGEYSVRLSACCRAHLPTPRLKFVALSRSRPP